MTIFYSSNYIARLSPTCQFAESVLSLHVHLFKFHPQERCYTDIDFFFFFFFFFFLINLFGSLWIYLNIRYENFHCSVIVDNMKEDCVLLEKLRKFQRVVHVLCALCALGFNKDRKVRKLERYVTPRSIPIWVLTSRHTEYEYDVSVQAGDIVEIYSSSVTKSDIHYRMLATMVLLTFLLKCCVMTQQEGIM